MHMMVPVSAGTLRVVWVKNRNQAIPARAAGSGANNNEGIEPRLKIHDDQEIHEQHGKK